MKLTIRYFAAARELCGRDREEIEVPEASLVVHELARMLGKRHPRLEEYIHRMRMAINEDFASQDAPLKDGDEVVIMPPVAGGVDEVLVAIRQTPLSVDECLRAVSHAGAGGICVFTGVVRDHADDKDVAKLEYEAYVELATKEMRRIVEQVMAEMPGVRLAATHRIGSLEVGDAAVVVAASSAHRAEAFEACRATIDRIKESVPVWKKEWAPDGTANWVNLDG